MSTNCNSKRKRCKFLAATVGVFSLLTSPGCQNPDAKSSTPSPRAESTPTSLEVAIFAAKRERMQAKIELSGQVNPTEEGSVAVTTPLDGVILRPLVKVGDFVTKDQPLAELNSVFGQTSLQIMNQLETLQVGYREAQKNLAASQTGLAQARTALGQSYAAVSAARSANGQADAERTAARADLRRKIELEKAGVFAQADVDEVRNRSAKAEAIYHDTLNQIEVVKRLVPYNQRSVAEFEGAVKLNRHEVSVAEAAFERNQAVLLQSNLVGSSLPSGLSSSLQLGKGIDSSVARAASHFSLRAPISGIISDLSITPGLKITNGTAVGNVTDIRQVYVDANAFESDVGQMREGDRIEVTSIAYPSRIFSGRVKYVGRRVQADTRAIIVRTLIDNPSQLLRPSMFVKVRVESAAQSNVLVIPTSAILTAGDEVYVVIQSSPGKFEKRKITIGAAAESRTQVLSGLKEGELVVTQGNLLLNVRDHQD